VRKVGSLKKAVLFVLFLILITLIIEVCTHGEAYKKEEKIKNYIALGDSITAGYLLPEGEQSFPEILSAEHNYDLVNMAVVGMTSSELLEQLYTEDYEDVIKAADLITVDIGSNDLLGPFNRIISETFEVENTQDISSKIYEQYKNHPVELAKKVAALGLNLQNNTEINEAVTKYKQITFPAIIGKIQEINPKAKIIAVNIYNPYSALDFGGLLSIGKIAEKYISEMNTAFDLYEGYEVADVYSYFDTIGITNTKFDITQKDGISFDPHPNKQGHMVIYTVINRII
jgi:lysophospholipase L1-like esterase